MTKIIIRMPFGGQANALKGKRIDEAFAEAVFGSSVVFWGLGKRGTGCKSVIAGPY